LEWFRLPLARVSLLCAESEPRGARGSASPHPSPPRKRRGRRSVPPQLAVVGSLRSRSRLTQPLARVSVALRRERNARHTSECHGRAKHSLGSLEGCQSLAHATRLYRSRALSLHSLLWRVHSARDLAFLPPRLRGGAGRGCSSIPPCPVPQFIIAHACERRGRRGARPGLPPSQAQERASTTPREGESPARHTRSR
jgi:hypothetical protein